VKGIKHYIETISLRKLAFTFVKRFAIHGSFCHLWSYELSNSKTNNSSHRKREFWNFTM